jgi:Bardet-Biedl syndrome 7 protein
VSVCVVRGFVAGYPTCGPRRVSKSLLLATYRCQESVNRLEIAARTVEGQYGDVQVTIIPNVTPGKTAQIVKFNIKPLSLHYRVHDELDERPMNKLQFSGPFTLSQMHEWIILLLPDVPSRIPDEDVSMSFRNAFVGTQLSVRYKKVRLCFGEWR